MPRMQYKGFHLLPSYAEHSGYIVQESAGETRLIGVIVKDPDAVSSGRWKMRPYYAPRDTAWGRYPRLVDAAQAAYDERPV